MSDICIFGMQAMHLGRQDGLDGNIKAMDWTGNGWEWA